MPLLIIRPRFSWAGLGFECDVAGEGERVTCMLYSETLVVIYVLDRVQMGLHRWCAEESRRLQDWHSA